MMRNRLITPITVTAFSIVAAYVIAWFLTAQILKAGIEDWIVDRRAAGWVVEHGPISMNGFPYSWRAAVENPSLAQTVSRRTIGWSGPAIELSWKPWSPRTVHYATKGAILYARNQMPTPVWRKLR